MKIMTKMDFPKEGNELGLNDFDPDFDKDGHADGIEVENGTDPKDPYDPVRPMTFQLS